jgi:hypothetical protein
MSDAFISLLSELSKLAPHAIVIIAVIMVNNSMSKHIIKTMNQTFDSALEHTKNAYKDATEQLRENMKLLNEISEGKTTEGKNEAVRK